MSYVCLADCIYLTLATRKERYRHPELISEGTRSIIIQLGQWTTLSKAGSIGKCHWFRHLGFSVEEESLIVQEIANQSLGPRNSIWAKKKVLHRCQRCSAKERGYQEFIKLDMELKVLQTMSFSAEKHISAERTLRGTLVHEAQIGKEAAPTSTVHHR